MAEEDEDHEAVARLRLLELLEGDDWELSERAEREGKIALHWLHDRTPTQWELVEYVISLIKSTVEMRCSPQGDPPGSTGIAWQMTEERNIFIKLRICERRIGEEFAYIQSIHESVHTK